MERKSFSMDDIMTGNATLDGSSRVDSGQRNSTKPDRVSPFSPLFSLPVESHVILPKELAKTLPKSRLLTESEWRGIGVQQSRGWQHYAIHR
jgi:Cyclin-dependent kinase regulatory subunit